jgi:cyclic beta-1,2-glucan synthetase
MDFARLCDLISFANDAASYRQQAETVRSALEAHGWDGKWYRRAYYDDGKPVGSANNRDCQIDSISQSWAVISGAGDPQRAHMAMESLYERLVRHDADGLVLLLTPPFDRSIHDPGYIKGYVPGIRENGGQYTHAALWAIWAFADLGQAERVYELFRMINPIYDTDAPEKINRYYVEPYVIAADVYSHPSHVGRGGWTWYTGSASWMTRLAVEKILGLKREGNNLTVEPCIPKDWREYEIHYRFGKTMYHLRVENPEGVNTGVVKLTVDGKLLTDEKIVLEDDGREHQIVVTIGGQVQGLPATVKEVQRKK